MRLPQLSLSPLLFTLEYQVEYQDDDDRQDDHNSRTETENILNLKHEMPKFYLSSLD